MKAFSVAMIVGAVMAGIVYLTGKGDATSTKVALGILVIAFLIGVGACLGLS